MLPRVPFRDDTTPRAVALREFRSQPQLAAPRFVGALPLSSAPGGLRATQMSMIEPKRLKLSSTSRSVAEWLRLPTSARHNTWEVVRNGARVQTAMESEHRNETHRCGIQPSSAVRPAGRATESRRSTTTKNPSGVWYEFHVRVTVTFVWYRSSFVAQFAAASLQL